MTPIDISFHHNPRQRSRKIGSVIIFNHPTKDDADVMNFDQTDKVLLALNSEPVKAAILAEMARQEAEAIKQGDTTSDV